LERSGLSVGIHVRTFWRGAKARPCDLHAFGHGARDQAIERIDRAWPRPPRLIDDHSSTIAGEVDVIVSWRARQWLSPVIAHTTAVTGSLAFTSSRVIVWGARTGTDCSWRWISLFLGHSAAQA
jgi:hypothetical protein